MRGSLVIWMCMAALLHGCSGSQKKEREVREQLRRIDSDLVVARKDTSGIYEQELRQFKTEAIARIQDNENILEDLKKILVADSSADTALMREIRGLESRNKTLKEALARCRRPDKDKWTTFRQEMSAALDMLDHAIRQLAYHTKPSEKKSGQAGFIPASQ